MPKPFTTTTSSSSPAISIWFSGATSLAVNQRGRFSTPDRTGFGTKRLHRVVLRPRGLPRPWNRFAWRSRCCRGARARRADWRAGTRENHRIVGLGESAGARGFEHVRRREHDHGQGTLPRVFSRSCDVRLGSEADMLFITTCVRFQCHFGRRPPASKNRTACEPSREKPKDCALTGLSLQFSWFGSRARSADLARKTCTLVMYSPRALGI